MNKKLAKKENKFLKDGFKKVWHDKDEDPDFHWFEKELKLLKNLPKNVKFVAFAEYDPDHFYVELKMDGIHHDFLNFESYNKMMKFVLSNNI